MKTIRELILERHQSAEAKLRAISAEDLAACARSAAQPSRQAPPACDGSTAFVRFWQETFWPWRRAWLEIAVTWVFILAFSLTTADTVRTASRKPSRPDPEVLAVLREQKQLLTQLLGSGAPPLVSNLRMPGPHSAAEPPTGRDEEAGRSETRLRGETWALLGSASGVRPSSGAAKSASSGALELANAADSLELAVPEDGRTTETFAQA